MMVSRTVCLLLVVCLAPAANGLEVRKTKSGLCHPPESPYYERLTTFVVFQDIKSCLASGGRLPTSLNRVALLDGRAANDDQYDREDFGHGWLEDDDPDCMDTRAELLLERSLEPVAFASAERCRVVSGRWVGFFTNQIYTNATDLDLDHIVPLAAAYRMGADQWPYERRIAFANDPLNLQFVSSRLNRSKGARTPAEWMPPANQCQYTALWLAVIDKYSLVPDPSTQTALKEHQLKCNTTRTEVNNG